MKTGRIVVAVGIAVISLILSDTALALPNIQLGSAAGAPGETVEISVTFANNGSVVGFQFDVQFNSTQFAVGDLTDGSVLPPHLRHQSTPSPGTLRVLIRPQVSPSLPNINDGVLVNIPFTINAGATPGLYDLTLTGVVFSDNSANAVSGGTLTNGQLTVGSPDISISPPALSFGEVQVGTSSSSKIITVSNAISATADLTITQIEVVGMNASEFGQTNNCGTLTPNSSCTVNVTLTPSSAGGKAGVLKVTSNDPDQGTADVPLSGTGVTGTPQILARRVISSEDFSSGIPGTWTNADGWRTNCGPAIGDPFETPWAIVSPNCVPVSEELLYTPIFDASSCTEVALLFSNRFSGAGSSAAISVSNDYGKTWPEGVLMEEDAGPQWKEVDISAAAGSEGAQIEFGYSTSGGFWAIDNVLVLCQPSGLVFKALQGIQSLSQTILITNPGTADLNITSIGPTGTNASEFQIESDCSGQPVPPGENCAIEVALLPTSTGSKNAELSILSNAGPSPLEVSLGGKGILLLVNPEEGTVGSQLTITGAGFGQVTGKVLVGGGALKVSDWKPGSIQGVLSKVVNLGSVKVDVQTKGSGVISEEGAFSVEKPKIWRVTPQSGPIGTAVTIRGKYFGIKKPKVYLQKGDVSKSCKVTAFKPMDPVTGISEVACLIPKVLGGLYNVLISNKIGEATLIGGFEVGD